MSVNPARVRQARLAAGLSLADLAGDDVSRTFIHFIEHGRSRPSKSVLDLIAKRTGKPVSYFTGGAGPAGESLHGLAAQLVELADRIRTVTGAMRLSGTEREAMRLLEVALRQGATLSRTVETPAKRVKSRRVRR